ncbi:MAG: GH3 auxin-responsive promoter family protein [Bacteroidales bacterium]|nr:GH3 auxin-responsive promoter family protein [Bacteroidales bacterium]
MQLVESVIRKAIIKKGRRISKKSRSSIEQFITLTKLLQKARHTAFGRHYNFQSILNDRDIFKAFQQAVPVFDYEKLYQEWWHRLLKGEQDITWPGKVKYFGLTSGTSNDASKRVPVTHDMKRAMQKTGTRQLFVLAGLDLPPNFLQKKILMLGGCTDLVQVEDYFEGDLSGILAGRLPIWFAKKYKPGKQISRVKDWNEKLNEIVRQAPDWDIGGIAGVPAWVQMLIERIIDHYGLETIHDIWPNFCVYSHGGVSFEPYRKTFDKLLSRKVYFLETYLASEGFLAYQADQDVDMHLVLDNGIFFEFVPFTGDNFDSNGNIREGAEALLLTEVSENTDYALLISTVSGAWRYLIGDTIRFTSLERNEIIITGRTKHFLSLCGEHLSVDNMNKAVEMVADELNIDIKEFTVAGIPYEGFFAHKWYLGVGDTSNIEAELVSQKIDDALKVLNDDYAVERRAALKRVIVEMVPHRYFYEWMDRRGKAGGQHKFPRVLKNHHEDWEAFLDMVQKQGV